MDLYLFIKVLIHSDYIYIFKGRDNQKRRRGRKQKAFDFARSPPKANQKISMGQIGTFTLKKLLFLKKRKQAYMAYTAAYQKPVKNS